MSDYDIESVYNESMPLTRQGQLKKDKLSKRTKYTVSAIVTVLCCTAISLGLIFTLGHSDHKKKNDHSTYVLYHKLEKPDGNTTIVDSDSMGNLGARYSYAFNKTFPFLNVRMSGVASLLHDSESSLYIKIDGTLTLLNANKTLYAIMLISHTSGGKLVQIGVKASSPEITLGSLDSHLPRAFLDMGLNNLAFDASNYNGLIGDISFKDECHFEAITKGLPGGLFWPLTAIYRTTGPLNRTFPPLDIEGWVYPGVGFRVSLPNSIPVSKYVIMRGIDVMVSHDSAADTLRASTNFLVSPPNTKPLSIEADGKIQGGQGHTMASFHGKVVGKWRLPEDFASITISETEISFKHDGSLPLTKRNSAKLSANLEIFGENVSVSSDISASDFHFSLYSHPDTSLSLKGAVSMDPTLDTVKLMIMDGGTFDLNIEADLALTIQKERVKIPSTLEFSHDGLVLSVSEVAPQPIVLLRVGHSAVSTSDFKGSLRIGWPHSANPISGSLIAIADFGTNSSNVDIRFNLDFGVQSSLVMELTKPMNLGNFIGITSGVDDALTSLSPFFDASGGGSKWLNSIIIESAKGDVSLVMNPLHPFNLRLASTISIDGVGPFATVFELHHIKSQWHWAFAFLYGSGAPVTFDSAFPELGHLKQVFGESPPISLGAGVASGPIELNMGSGMKPYTMKAGLNLFGEISLMRANSPDILKTLHEYLKVDLFEFSAVVSSFTDMRFSMGVEGNLPIDQLDLTYAGIFVNIAGADVSVGLESQCTLQLSKRPTDKLYFTGDIFISDVAFNFDAAMTTPWIAPFGLRGVKVPESELKLAINVPTMVPTSIGIGGGLIVGDVGGSADVMIDLVDVTRNVFAADLQHLNLQLLIDGIFGDFGMKTPPHLVQVFTDISLKKLSVDINSGVSALVFNEETFYPGIHVNVSQLNLWEIVRGNCSVSVDKKGLFIDGEIEPISLLNGLVTISGAESPSSPAILSVHLGTNFPVDAYVKASGAVDIFEESVAAELIISDHELLIFIDVDLFDHLFKFTLNGTAVGTPIYKPSDFSVMADMEQHVLDWIGETVPKRLKVDSKTVQALLKRAELNVTQSIENLSGLQVKIDELKRADQKGLSEAEIKLHNAKSAVLRAKHTVEHIQKSINSLKEDLKKLHWYDLFRETGDAVTIEALEVAKGVAEGVLSEAAALLDDLAKAVDVLPDLDPRIVALEMEYGIENGALHVAKSILKGAEKLSGVFFEMSEWVAKAVSKVFNIEEMGISGSLAAIKRGDLINIHLKGLFFDKPVNFKTDINLKTVDSVIGAIWKAIVKAF